MDDREAATRHLEVHRAFYRLFDGTSPGARFVERDDGLAWLTCPARPERSLLNAVLYRDRAVLAAALPELAAAYDAAGIEAWTVWVHPGDDDAARACADNGHVLDATPALMWARLDDGFELGTGDAVLDDDPSWRVVGDVNDAAFELPRHHLAAVAEGLDPAAGLRAAALDGDGRPVSCAVVVTAGDVAEVCFVATVPAARGRGLAAACMRAALRRAREHGATLTMLEATKLGEPVYARMGYRTAGTLQMWERRVTAAA